MTHGRNSRTLIGLITLMVVRLLLAGWFTTMTPLWENFDEVNHYYVAQYRGGIDDALPQQEWSPEYQIFNQISQPPLYHFLVGSLIRPFSEPIPTPLGSPQPFCPNRQASNFYIHHLDNETPFTQPYRGIWLARSITIVIGAVSVVAVWFAARMLWAEAPNRAWLAALLYVLFSPAAALSSWFNNDAPLMLIGALMLILLAHVLQCGISWRLSLGMIVLLGIGLGIKITVIALLPAILLVVLYRLIFQTQHGRMRRFLLLIGVLSLAVFIFVMVNFGLCGQAFCRTHRALTLENFTVLTNPIINRYTLPSFQELLQTLSTPAINSAHPSPLWVTIVACIILFVGGSIAILAAIESSHERKPLILLLVIIFSAISLGLLRVWWLGVAFLPARYIAVALPALILWIAVGYDFLRTRLHWTMGIVPVAVFIVANIVALYSSYMPLSQMPPRLTELPPEAIRADIPFENGVHVAAFTVENDTLRLYLTTDMPLTEPLVLEATLLDGAGQSLFHCEMLAGNPVWSTLDWQVNEYVVQPIRLPQLADIMDTMYVRIRLVKLQNTIFINPIPDYQHEVYTLSGDNWLDIPPDLIRN
jgi:4-amino-4-deoxy-L-arabinose transferase-like glycosyltransferase